MGKSKDLATSSLSSDLTVDTDTFHVDVADNRVGVGTTAPDRIFTIRNGGPVVEIDPAGASSNPIYFNYNRSTSAYLTPEYWALGHKFMRNGGSTALEIDSSGRVTKPSQPSFRATSSSGISTGSNVSTLVLPTVKHNVGNHYNSSTYTFTCPVAGLYYFGFHGNVRDVGSSSTTSVYAQIMKNGSRQGIYYCSDEPNAAWHLLSGSIVVSCAANDAILVSSGANAYWDSSDWTQFYGYLLG